MSNPAPGTPSNGLGLSDLSSLCPRGLATSNPDQEGEAERTRDETVICSVFNRWFGPMQALEPGEKERELSDRKAALQALARLYDIGGRHAGAARRRLRATDVENVFTLFRRLFLLWKARPHEIADFCEAQERAEAGIKPHIADPLQVRAILSFHREMPHGLLEFLEISKLRAACTASDYDGIQAWYDGIAGRKHNLPRETPQFLRHVVFDLWRAAQGDLEGVAFEHAVLEVRLFGAIGWENSRLFYSLLNRVGGSSRQMFAAYVTTEEVDEAIDAYQAAGDATQAAYFRSVLAAYDKGVLGTMRGYVFGHAEQRG